MLGADHCFVVMAYKENPFLEDCILSLKAQTVPSPIVISTSTPNPHVDAVARRHGLNVFVNPVARGIGADWNYALQVAHARFVTLAHQDDRYGPEFVVKTVSAFRSTPDAVMVFTGANQIDDAGGVRVSKVSAVKQLLLNLIAGRHAVISGLRGRLLLSFGNPISCSSVTFNRDRLQGFRFSEALASNLDWDAWVTFVRRGDALAYVPDRLVQRRYNDLTETSQLLRDGRRPAEDRAMFERLWPRPVSSILSRLYALGY